MNNYRFNSSLPDYIWPADRASIYIIIAFAVSPLSHIYLRSERSFYWLIIIAQTYIRPSQN